MEYLRLRRELEKMARIEGVPIEDDACVVDGWTYRIEPRGRYFALAVYDEEGERLSGRLQG